MARLGRRHVLAIAANERLPARVGPRLRLRPRHQVGRRRELRQPDVVIVLASVVLLPDSPGWPTHGPDAEAFPRTSWFAESDNEERHTSATAHLAVRLYLAERWSRMMLPPNHPSKPACPVRQTIPRTAKNPPTRDTNAVQEAGRGEAVRVEAADPGHLNQRRENRHGNRRGPRALLAQPRGRRRRRTVARQSATRHRSRQSRSERVARDGDEAPGKEPRTGRTPHRLG